MIDYLNRGFLAPFFILAFALLLSCKSNPNQSGGKGSENVDICDNLDTLNVILAYDTTNGELYSCRAELLYEKKDYVNALYDIQMAMQLKGNNVEDLLLLADVYWGLGNPNQARLSLNYAESLDNTNYEVYYALGKHFYLLENYELSRNYLLKSIQLEPANPYSYSLLGEIDLSRGDTTSAINYFYRAVQVDNSFFPAYMQLATVNLVQNTPLTPRYLENALSINDKSNDAYYMLGVYYQQNGQFRKAVENYSKLYELNPEYVLASYNAGYIYLAELNVFDTAIIWFDRAIAVDSNFYDAIYNRSYSYELLGNTAKADSGYRYLLKIKPDYELAKQRLKR